LRSASSRRVVTFLKRCASGNAEGYAVWDASVRMVRRTYCAHPTQKY